MIFQPFPKIHRLFRDIIITEKLDGTNAAVVWLSAAECDPLDPAVLAEVDDLFLFAQSRTRLITPGKNTDNYDFAQWAQENAKELRALGHGHHYGEWWGKGIQRNYGLTEKRFSLFNVTRWADSRPGCCHVVPLIYQGPMHTNVIREFASLIEESGSRAAPGFMNPEGLIIYHAQSSHPYKFTFDGDGHKGTPV